MNKPEINVAILKPEQENQDLNCFLLVLFYIGEVLFYPPIMLVYYLLVLILSCIVMIVLGALMIVLLPFFPFYLICCACEKGRPIASILCSLSALGIVLIITSALYLAFSPLIAVGYFFWTYVLIFSGKVNPRNSMAENWSVMTVYLNRNKEYVLKVYEERKGKMTSQ